MKLSLKIIILGALVIGLETQLAAYYSKPDRKNIIGDVESIAPRPPVSQPPETNKVIEIANDGTISSNIIMVWNDGKNYGYHSFDVKQMASLQRVARSLRPEQFEALMIQARHMSTTEFVSYVRAKEDALLTAPQMARVN